jgi:hypothetical protein
MTMLYSVQCTVQVSAGDQWIFGADLDPEIHIPYLWLMDPEADPNPAIFVCHLKTSTQIFFSSFFAYNIYIYIIFQR